MGFWPALQRVDAAKSWLDIFGLLESAQFDVGENAVNFSILQIRATWQTNVSAKTGVRHFFEIHGNAYPNEEE